MAGHSNFNPRTPRGVRQWLESYQKKAVNISIHAPREGCDHQGLRIPPISQYFNPRTPRGVRPFRARQPRHLPQDFNPRTPRGVRLDSGYLVPVYVDISIHAPREGCDKTIRTSIAMAEDFNPRTPRGVRRDRLRSELRIYGFQSTHPARGATCFTKSPAARLPFQSTHPARGATRNTTNNNRRKPFQSTHPARGATAPPQGRLKSPNFNPRTPRGVRHIEAQSGFYPMQFQSTHPARGATTPVSIPTTTPRHFNPRTPRGVRLHHCRAVLPTCRFQSTHPARGATAQ